MKILSYLNVSNLDNIESDSGYIFNYTLAYALRNRGEHFSIILPYETKGLSTRFSDDMCFYAKMGKTKYEARFFIDWIRIANIVAEYKPDVILLNQSELTAAFRSMLNDNGLGRVKIITYCHYPALHFENGNSILDYSLNDGNVAQSIVFSILTGINIADAFVIQSAFAKKLLLNYAKEHNVSLKCEINVFPPPYDTSFYTEKIEIKHGIEDDTMALKLFMQYGRPALLNNISVVHIWHRISKDNYNQLSENKTMFDQILRKNGIKCFHVGRLLYDEDHVIDYLDENRNYFD